MFEFAERLKALRKNKGVTQKQLSVSLNVTERAVVAYESGKMKPSFDAINSLADYFDVSTDYLLGRTDNPNLYFIGENPPITSEDFLNNIILDTRQNHHKKLAKSKGEISEPAFEYADNLLRHYHKALIEKLQQAGISL